jgi:hypothetical protein
MPTVLFTAILLLLAPVMAQAQDTLSIDSVGPPPCPPTFAVQLDKMNVLYIGLDNPAYIAMDEIDPRDVQVLGEGIAIRRNYCSNYTVTAQRAGIARLRVYGPGRADSAAFVFRVKRLPDPIARLGAQYRSRTLPVGTFKAQGGIAAVLECCDFDAKCDMVSFDVLRQPVKGDVRRLSNTGARWTKAVSALIQEAQPGDRYAFQSIKCRCPGDEVSRDIGSLDFLLK